MERHSFLWIELNYWNCKIIMSTYIYSIGSWVWEISLDNIYVVLRVQACPFQVESHDMNNKVHNTLFLCLSSWVWSSWSSWCYSQDLVYPREILWGVMTEFWWEYKKFVQLTRESIDYLFALSYERLQNREDFGTTYKMCPTCLCSEMALL
jgi:hypothetical protein